MKRLTTSLFSALIAFGLLLASVPGAVAAQKTRSSAKSLVSAKPASLVQKRKGARATDVAKRKISVKNFKAVRHVVMIPAKPSFGELAGLHLAPDALDLKSSVALVIDQDTREVLFSSPSDRAIAYQFVSILSKNVSSQPARKRRFLTPTLLVRSWLRRFTQK